MGDINRQRGVDGIWDAYSSYIHCPQSGDNGTVGGSTSDIQSLTWDQGSKGGGQHMRPWQSQEAL